MIAVVTCMRNAGGFLSGYREMIEAFAFTPGRVFVVENGSTDDTAFHLAAWMAADDRVRARSSTAPHVRTPTMPRVATPERSAYMAAVWNEGVEFALSDPSWTHALVTSTQKWSPPIATEKLLRHDLDVVAALVVFRHVHYDTWCSQRLDGSRLEHGARPDGQLVEMAGVGGVYLVRREVYEAGCRYAPTDGMFCESVAFCHQARAKGFRVWMDRGLTSVACWEPADLKRCLREGGRWAGGIY